MMRFIKKDVLFVEYGEQIIRGMVIRCEGKKISILDFVESRLPEDKEVESNIKQFPIKLTSYSKKVVILNNDVRFLASELPISPEIKIEPDKLLEAAKWEISPYLDFSVEEGRFGYQLQRSDKDKKSVPIFITAISKEDYSHLKDICNNLGLVLQNVYPERFSFFFAITVLPPKGRYKIMLNLNRDLTVAALISSDGPVTVHEISISDRDDLNNVVKSLREEISLPGIKADEIVITGQEHKYIQEVAGELKIDINVPVRLWMPDKDIRELDSTNKNLKIGPQFASIIGTALLEFGIIPGGYMGINDMVPLSKRLKDKIYTLPVVMVGIIVAIFLIHYIVIKVSLMVYSSNVKNLEAEKKNLKPLQ